jgi:hypothetical protein
MSVSEGVSARLIYKAYSSGTLSPTSEQAPASAPGSSGGRILRRTTHTLNLKKNAFRSNEIRGDRQVGDMRHGTRRVEGSISGELSPATWFDFQEAAHRHTKVASITDSNTEFTNCAADNGASTFTFGGGDPVAEGYRVGDVIRFSNLSEALNNSRNFTILSFGGASNRTVTVTPAPTTMTADTSFNVTRPGVATFIPSTGHVSRAFAFEDNDEVLDVSRLFTECRISGYRMGIPAEGMATFEAMVMGRGQTVLTGASAPFFTAPTAITSTSIAAGPSGVVRVGGTTVGVVTGLDLTLQMAAEAPSVVGQAFPPDIFLGTARVTGTLTALYDDEVFLNNFANEDEISVLLRADAAAGAAPDCVSIFLPRIKFTGADIQRSGEGGQAISLPFEALRFLGSTAGVESTTIRIHDVAAS